MVPLDCEATVWFESQSHNDSNFSQMKTLRFDCSFLSPFRQDAKIFVTCGAHGDRSISLDDFVIPRIERSANIFTETISSSGFK